MSDPEKQSSSSVVERGAVLDKEKVIKLVRWLATVNRTPEHLAEAIIEDIEYGQCDAEHNEASDQEK